MFLDNKEVSEGPKSLGEYVRLAIPVLYNKIVNEGLHQWIETAEPRTLTKFKDMVEGDSAYRRVCAVYADSVSEVLNEETKQYLDHLYELGMIVLFLRDKIEGLGACPKLTDSIKYAAIVSNPTLLGQLESPKTAEERESYTKCCKLAAIANPSITYLIRDAEIKKEVEDMLKSQEVAFTEYVDYSGAAQISDTAVADKEFESNLINKKWLTENPRALNAVDVIDSNTLKRLCTDNPEVASYIRPAWYTPDVFKTAFDAVMSDVIASLHPDYFEEYKMMRVNTLRALYKLVYGLRALSREAFDGMIDTCVDLLEKYRIENIEEWAPYRKSDIYKVYKEFGEEFEKFINERMSCTGAVDGRARRSNRGDYAADTPTRVEPVDKERKTILNRMDLES